MLSIVLCSQRCQRVVVPSSYKLSGNIFYSVSRLTGMHSSQHAGDEFVDAVALLNQRDQRGYPALVVTITAEMGEYQFLKLLNLVLETH